MARTTGRVHPVSIRKSFADTVAVADVTASIMILHTEPSNIHTIDLPAPAERNPQGR